MGKMVTKWGKMVTKWVKWLQNGLHKKPQIRTKKCQYELKNAKKCQNNIITNCNYKRSILNINYLI